METEKKKALLELIKECDEIQFLEKIIREEKGLSIISGSKKKHPTRERLESGYIVDGEEFEIMLREEKEEEDREVLSLIFDELETIKQMLSNRVVYIDGEKYYKF